MMELLIPLSILLLVVLLLLAFPVAVKILLRRRFLTQPRNTDMVYLTFDDGPSPETTAPIVELLAAADAKATFFFVGQRVRQHSRLVASVIEQGHEVGNHGFAHLHPWRVSPAASLRDLKQGALELAKHGFPSSPYLRPPFGKFGLFSALWVLVAGQHAAFWSIDPRDYSAETVEEVVEHVMSRLEGGAVILLHDGLGDNRNNPELIVDVVRTLLVEIPKRGFQFGTLIEH